MHTPLLCPVRTCPCEGVLHLSKTYALWLDLYSGDRITLRFDTLEEAQSALNLHVQDAEVQDAVIYRSRPEYHRNDDTARRPRYFTTDESGTVATPSEEDYYLS